MSEDLQHLRTAIEQRRAILFVGAGISMSVGLPSWQELIQHLLDELELEPESGLPSPYSHHMLAEYHRLKLGSIGPLRSWMDRTWRVSEEKVRASRVHELIVSLDFPIIYTTNFDRNLEIAYELHEKPFVKIVTARDVVRATN